MTQQKPRQFTLKDRAPAAIAYGSACRQGGGSERLDLSVSPAGEAQAHSHAGGMPADYQVLPEDGSEQEDAAREWLRHLNAGRIGGGRD